MSFEDGYNEGRLQALLWVFEKIGNVTQEVLVKIIWDEINKKIGEQNE
jgi:hypothetical protein